METRAVTFKVSERTGAVSVYGLGRFPVTLYWRQWKRLVGAVPELVRFLDENRASGKLTLLDSDKDGDA